MTTAHDPIHPGEILTPIGMTQYRLAQTISVPARRIIEIVHGKRAISPDTALRLSRALSTQFGPGSAARSTHRARSVAPPKGSS